MVGQASISHLPVQLLARILALLDPAERLGSAALVATAWRTAAALGTDTVNLHGRSLSAASADAVSKPFDSLSAWLAANSHAGITRLEAIVSVPDVDHDAPTEELPLLQLPSLQRLPGLAFLHCYGLAVRQGAPGSSGSSTEAGAAAAAAAGTTAAAVTTVPAAAARLHLPLELSAAPALTELQFWGCDVDMRGLSTLTRLQSLTLGVALSCGFPDAITSRCRTQLQQALPHLQALVTLRLYGVVAQDSVLQHVSSLPRLGELLLVDGVFTPAGFRQQLPQSLTSLALHWGVPAPAQRTLTASTAPGLCTLTGLQLLEVTAGAVGMDLLASLTSLRHLDLREGAHTLEGPGSLSGLAALTQLTFLGLAELAPGVIASDADVAALTASPQLAWLDIRDTELEAPACAHMFAAGRQLLQLTMLEAGLELIHDGRGASLVAACCPNLAWITLSSSEPHAWVEDADDAASGLASMLTRWQPLQHLTHLRFDAYEVPMAPNVWRALGRLTQLQELNVSNMASLGFLAGVLHLRSCHRLRSLGVDARAHDGLMDRVQLEVTGEQAEDGTTTLHQQLPKALQQAILDQASEDNTDPGLLGVLVRCTAAVQQAQEQQLAQQQGEIAELRREVGGLRASLAAAPQQLPGQASGAQDS